MQFSDKDFERKFKQLMKDSRNPVVLKENKRKLKAEIKNFEQKYEMSSDEMKKRWNSGQLEETDEICQWLMKLNLDS